MANYFTHHWSIVADHRRSVCDYCGVAFAPEQYGTLCTPSISHMRRLQDESLNKLKVLKEGLEGMGAQNTAARVNQWLSRLAYIPFFLQCPMKDANGKPCTGLSNDCPHHPELNPPCRCGCKPGDSIVLCKFANGLLPAGCRCHEKK